MMPVAFAVLMLTATPQGASAPPPVVATDADAEKKICRRIGTTGTRVGGAKRCLTKQQWADLAARNTEQSDQRVGQFSSNR
jgi:hypothetical protein